MIAAVSGNLNPNHRNNNNGNINRNYSILDIGADLKFKPESSAGSSYFINLDIENLYGINLSRCDVVIPIGGEYRNLYRFIADDLVSALNTKFIKNLRIIHDNGSINPERDYILIGNWFSNNWTLYLYEKGEIPSDILEKCTSVLEKKGLDIPPGDNLSDYDA